jgi:hypothetical protein
MGTVGGDSAVGRCNGAAEQISAVQLGTGGYGYYNTDVGGSCGQGVVAALPIPAGATLWRLDVYGYQATAAGGQSWSLNYANLPANGLQSLAGSITTNNAAGEVTGSLIWTNGLAIAAGNEYFVAMSGTTANNAFMGASFQYTLPTVSLVPITPVRVFDSRFSSKLTAGHPRTINVKNAIDVNTGTVTVTDAIPQGARAISFTITITGTVGAGGYVAVLPGTATTVTASTVNWSAKNQTLAAGGVVSLGIGTAERQITLVSSGTTDVIVDVTGYYE